MHAKSLGLAALVLLLAAAAPAFCQSNIPPLPPGLRLPKPDGPCNCAKTPTTDDPVCGEDLVTYGNECVAQCANVLVSGKGQCAFCTIKSGDCQCGNDPYTPVCAFGLTWTSKCDADCGGYSCPQSPGVCRYHPNGTFTETSPASSAAGGVAAASAKTALPAASSAKYSYTEGLHKTLMFFESMQSGVLARQRFAWRGDSCQDCVGPKGEDMSGGFYEAGGSFLKLGLVEAFLVTMLGWSVDSFPKGFMNAGDLQNALDATQWGADYLVAAHSAPNQFVAVVGNSTLDFNYYGPVEEYQDYVKSRPSCYINAANPGSEIAGEAAAGLAAAYIVLSNNSHGDFSKYLTHAKQLYTFATTNPGSYQDATDPCLAQHGLLYKSTGYVDELAWAAAWLYKATNTASYLADAKKYYGQLSQPGYSFETGEKVPGLNVLMAQIDPSNAATYNANAQQFFNLYLQQTIPHTPRGLAYPYHWGALRPATQVAMLALIHSKNLRAGGSSPALAGQLFNYAKYQIDYVLGDSGRSWLVGYGKDYPEFLWHKLSYNTYIDWPLRGVSIYANWSAQQTTGTVKRFLYLQASKLDMEGSFRPQRFIAYGALYGAPLKDDNLPLTRKDFTYAETTTDGVTGITGALAGLSEYFTTLQTKQNDCGLDLGWTHPNATLTTKSVNNTAVCLGLKSSAGAIPAKTPGSSGPVNGSAAASPGAGSAMQPDSLVTSDQTPGSSPSSGSTGSSSAAASGGSQAAGSSSAGTPSSSTTESSTSGAPAPAPQAAHPLAAFSAAGAMSIAAGVALLLAALA